MLLLDPLGCAIAGSPAPRFSRVFQSRALVSSSLSLPSSWHRCAHGRRRKALSVSFLRRAVRVPAERSEGRDGESRASRGPPPRVVRESAARAARPRTGRGDDRGREARRRRGRARKRGARMLADYPVASRREWRRSAAAAAAAAGTRTRASSRGRGLLVNGIGRALARVLLRRRRRPCVQAHLLSPARFLPFFLSRGSRARFLHSSLFSFLFFFLLLFFFGRLRKSGVRARGSALPPRRISILHAREREFVPSFVYLFIFLFLFFDGALYLLRRVGERSIEAREPV